MFRWLGPSAENVGKSHGKCENNAWGKMNIFGLFFCPWIAISCKKNGVRVLISFPMFLVLFVFSHDFDTVFSWFYCPCLPISRFDPDNCDRSASNIVQKCTDNIHIRIHIHMHMHIHIHSSRNLQMCSILTLKGISKKPELAKVLCENSGTDVGRLMDKYNLDLSLVARLGSHSAP